MSISINDQNDQISTTTGILKQTDTGGLVVASGVDLGKPTPVGNNGLIRYNTTNNALEVVVNGAYHTVAFTDSISGFLPIAGGTMLGTLAAAVGTVSAPNLTFSNSSTTGFFSPIANVIAVTSNGTESLRIDNLGNVGIGKTPGAVRLDVTSAALSAALASTGSDYPLALYGQTTVTPVLVGAVGGSFAVKTNAALTPQFTVDSSYSYTTTPFPGDNTTKVATTAFVTAALGISGTQTVITQEFASSGTYTPTPGMVFCEVEIVGGGGGSAACQGGISNGTSGGGSGAYIKASFTAAQVGASKSITVGSGGAAGAIASAGNAGGTSSFGSYLTCTGGAGGSVQSFQDVFLPGGAGGTATNSLPGSNIISIDGQSGAIGGQNAQSHGGQGGSNPLGQGGPATIMLQAGTVAVNGIAGKGYGSGASGSGAQPGSGASVGAAGAGGYVIIKEYIGLPSFGSLNLRTKLTANTTFYVSTTGNNSNSGLTAGSPWLTLQYAYNYIAANIDISGFTCIIQAADGTYTSGINALIPTVGGVVQIQGNIATPANCIISSGGSPCIAAYDGVTLIVNGGFKLTGTTYILMARGSGSNITVTGAMNYGTGNTGGAGLAHINAFWGGFVEIQSSYTISGNIGNHMYCAGAGTIFIGVITVTLTGTPSFTAEYARAVNTGNIEISNTGNYVGSATGVAYFAGRNGVIDTATLGFPSGLSAGSTSNGGQYV